MINHLHPCIPGTCGGKADKLKVHLIQKSGIGDGSLFDQIIVFTTTKQIL